MKPGHAPQSRMHVSVQEVCENGRTVSGKVVNEGGFLERDMSTCA